MYGGHLHQEDQKRIPFPISGGESKSPDIGEARKKDKREKKSKHNNWKGDGNMRKFFESDYQSGGGGDRV